MTHLPVKALWRQRGMEGVCNAVRDVPAADVLAQAIGRLKADRVDLLKLDIEGSEGDVLTLAARDGSLARVDRIVGEWHSNIFGNVATPPAEWLAMLEREGYAVSWTGDVQAGKVGEFYAVRSG